MINNKHVVLLAACVLTVINDISSEPVNTSYRRGREAEGTYNDYYYDIETQNQAGREGEYAEYEGGEVTRGELWGRKRRSDSSAEELVKSYRCLQSAAKNFLKLANKTVMEKMAEEVCSSSSTSTACAEAPKEQMHKLRRKFDEDLYEEDDEQASRQTAKVELSSTDLQETVTETTFRRGLEDRLKVRKRQRKSRRNRMTMATLTDEAVLKLLEIPSMRGPVFEEDLQEILR